MWMIHLKSGTFPVACGPGLRAVLPPVRRPHGVQKHRLFVHSVIMSSFLSLNTKDLVKGLIVAVLVVVVGSIQQALVAHGLDVAAYDWPTILDSAWKAAGAYLVKPAHHPGGQVRRCGEGLTCRLNRPRARIRPLQQS